MRASPQLCVFACILTLVVVGCRTSDPVGPEVQREAALAEDPCYPNMTPC